jgi:hypothetical protein
VALFCDRSVSLVADDEDARGGFDDVVGDGVELVDFQDPVDLGEESFEESEVPARDAFDGGDGLRICEVVGVEGSAEARPVTAAASKSRPPRMDVPSSWKPCNGGQRSGRLAPRHLAHPAMEPSALA